AACAGAEARLCAPLWNVDDVHGAVALACYEQFVPSECHVHRLRTDLDRRLLAKRWVYQTHRVAVQAGDADQAIVRRVTRDLRRLWHVLEDHLVADTAGFGVYQKQAWLRIVDCDHGAPIGRDSDTSEGAWRLNLAEQFSFRQVDDRNCALLLVLGIEPLPVRRDDQAVPVRRTGVDGVNDLMRLGVDHRDYRATLASDIDQSVGPGLERVRGDVGLRSMSPTWARMVRSMMQSTWPGLGLRPCIPSPKIGT